MNEHSFHFYNKNSQLPRIQEARLIAKKAKENMINFIEDISHNFFGGPVSARNQPEAEVADKGGAEGKELKHSPSENKDQWEIGQ